MDFFDSSGSIIENAYHLSGVLIALSLIIGLRQLALTKRIFKINSQRAAADLAAKQIEIYFEIIVPLHNEVFFKEIDEKIPRIDIKPGEFNQEYLKSKLGKQWVSMKDKRKPVGLDIVTMANAMESFSLYFTKGVADEEVAFSSVGHTFCNTVESYYFDLASSLDKDEKHWSNLIELYTLWSKRREIEKMVKVKDDIQERLHSEKLKVITPIGVK